jgi:hypothetical protein
MLPCPVVNGLAALVAAATAQASIARPEGGDIAIGNESKAEIRRAILPGHLPLDVEQQPYLHDAKQLFSRLRLFKPPCLAVREMLSGLISVN